METPDIAFLHPRRTPSMCCFIRHSSRKTNDELVMEMAVELERRIPCRVECHEEAGIVPKVSSQVVRLGLSEVLAIARETSDSDILAKLKKLEEEKKEKGLVTPSVGWSFTLIKLSVAMKFLYLIVLYCIYTFI